MSVSGISSTTSNNIDSPFAERRKNFEALLKALESGDRQYHQATDAGVLSGAQAPATADAGGVKSAVENAVNANA